MKVYATTFSVLGGGEFPMDMLRYDGCYPVGSDDAGRIADTFTRYTNEKPKPPDYTPIKLRHIGTSSTWRPTEGRWSSFNWGVDPASVVKEVRT